MKLEYLSRIKPPPNPRPGFWVSVIAITSGFLAFGCWCVIDYVTVRYGAGQAERFYLLWLLPPIILAAWSAYIFWDTDDELRGRLIITALLGAILLTAALILGGGPIFHATIR